MSTILRHAAHATLVLVAFLFGVVVVAPAISTEIDVLRLNPPASCVDATSLMDVALQVAPDIDVRAMEFDDERAGRYHLPDADEYLTFERDDLPVVVIVGVVDGEACMSRATVVPRPQWRG